MSSPDKTVAAFLPITIHGRLATGEAVTLIEAHNHSAEGYFGSPRYMTHYLVLGGLVAGLDQLCAAIRFRFGDSYWLAHLADGESYSTDRSTLSVQASEEGNWLVYEPREPSSIGDLEMAAIGGCIALAQLALDQDFVPRGTHLRIAGGDGRWLTVHGPAFDKPAADFSPATLLAREALTVERFAKWIL